MPKSKLTGFIRYATHEDMDCIHEWLIDQNERGVHGTFLCNWSVILYIFQNHGIFVYIDKEHKVPVGYLTKNFDILEVKESERGKGIGRALVAHGLKTASDSNETFIRVECVPSSSISFWSHMGFEIFDEKYGLIEIEKENPMKEDATPVDVEISFYPKCKKWDPDTRPVKTFTPEAMRAPDGGIDLRKRVSIFLGLPIWDEDPVVKIVVSGKILYEGKAKYDEASCLGLMRNKNSFYLDTIEPVEENP